MDILVQKITVADNYFIIYKGTVRGTVQWGMVRGWDKHFSVEWGRGQNAVPTSHTSLHLVFHVGESNYLIDRGTFQTHSKII